MPVQVLGLAEIKAKLNDLPNKMQQNVLRAGNRAVANAVRKEVEGMGGQVPATVVRAVTSQPNPKRMTTKGFLVGLRKPFSSMSHWFEFGTSERFHKSGKSVGAMKATPWLRPALERIKPRVQEIWSKAASRNLATQLRKLGR